MRLRHTCLIIIAALGLSSCLSGPPGTFSTTAPPSAPDYRQRQAWLAFPGTEGRERSTPQGLGAVDEATAPADVFFVHPTTTRAGDVWNARWDVTDEAAPLNPAVQLSQISPFNACCRLYAPRYRQATLRALGDDGAVDEAYADVAAAFRVFIADHNDGRPFIIASHSQGTMHAVRLMQEEILSAPLKDRLVAAYLIGGYVPANFGELGLPVCDSANQTGCVISWNAAKIGSLTARIIIHDKTYWWRGARRTEHQAPAVCVNPLTWRAGEAEGATPADQNPGSLPFPAKPYPDSATTMPALMPGLTGARCHDGMLEVALPSSAGPGYSDDLTRLFGSYHLNDFGLFYGALRDNAVVRTVAWWRVHGVR